MTTADILDVQDPRGKEAVDLNTPQHFRTLTGLLWNSDVEVRRKALRLIRSQPTSLYAEALTWKLADDDKEVVQLAEEALAALGTEVQEVLRRQIYAPVPEIRQRCAKLLGKCGRLADLVMLLVALTDYDIDVRESGRKGFKEIAGRHTDEWAQGKSRPNDEELRLVLARLFRVIATTDITSEISLTQTIVSFGAYGAPHLWKAYPDLEEKVRGALDSEFMRRFDETALEMLYRGLLVENAFVRKRVLSLLGRTIHRNSVRSHIQVLSRLAPDEKKVAAQLLDEDRLLGDFCDFVMWLSEGQRRELVELICLADPMKYESFLLQCLRFEDAEITRRVMEVLTRHADKDYREALMMALASPDEEVVLPAIQYFRRVGGASSVSYLLPLISDSRGDVARSATTAVSDIIRNRLMDNFSDLDDRNRDSLLQILHKLDSTFVTGLRDSLDDMEEGEKIRFAQILMTIGRMEDMSGEVGRLLTDPSAKVRATIARTLNIVAEVEVRRQYCEQLLNDPDARVRANTIEILPEGDLDPDLVNQLRHATRSDNNRERANALKKLLELGYAHYEIELESLLDHWDPWFRTSALWVVGQLKLRRLAPRLMAYTKDKFPPVRQHAILALRHLGTEEEIRHLTVFLEDPDERVRDAARVALRERLGLDFEEGMATDVGAA